MFRQRSLSPVRDQKFITQDARRAEFDERHKRKGENTIMIILRGE